MKVIVAGSRSITDYKMVKEAIEKSGFDVTEIVSGTARGVDRLGEKWARENGVPIHMFPADWDRHGKAAGYIRNTDMGKYADALICVWDGDSKGSKHMIDIMYKFGKPTKIFTPKKD